MDIIETMLSDSMVVDKYEAINRINPYPFSHGMKHILNVVNNADSLIVAFNLNDREGVILKTIAILHDLGQVDGRENHGLKAANFAREYLPRYDFFTNAEIDMICSAITTHDEHEDYSKLQNKFSWFINLIDKMDFSKHRLEDNSEEKFGYLVYNDIDSISYSINEQNFEVIIHSVAQPKIISEITLLDTRFIVKALNVASNFADHFNLNLVVYLDNVRLNLNINE